MPPRLKVGLVLFAGEAQVATPPTTDHGLVSEAIDEVDFFHGFGGTAIGDAIAAAVQVGLRSVGVHGDSVSALPQGRQLAAYVTAAKRPASTLVSILFLSDGHQTRGILQPLAGRRPRARGRDPGVHRLARHDGEHDDARLPAGLRRTGRSAAAAASAGRGLAPDPKTLHAIADRTGGKFFRAKSARLGQGRVRGARLEARPQAGHERGDRLVPRSARRALLVLAGALSALWSPRLP